MSPFISESRRRRRRPAGRYTPLAAVTVVLALVFAMPAFGGPSALSIAKVALKNANKALKTAKKALKPVGSSRIVNGAVISNKIANGAVGTTKITNGSVTNAKLAANSVGNANIADNSVGFAKLIDNSINGSKVANNSLTTDDLAGADVQGPLTVPAGIVSGNCSPVDITVNGALPGQVPLFALQAGSVLNNSFIITALKVPAVNTVTLRVCWVGGATSPAIGSLPVRIITFG